MSATRAQFLARSLLAAGTLAAGPLVAGAAGQDGDRGVLGLLVVLEQLEAALWAEGLAMRLDAGVRAAVKDVRSDDAAHLDALAGVLKDVGAAAPAQAPRFRFPARDQDTFLQTAVVVEDLVTGAYDAAAAAVRSHAALQTLAAIALVEGRHAAAVRIGASLSPAPFAVDPARPATQVRDAIAAWRVGTG